MSESQSPPPGAGPLSDDETAILAVLAKAFPNAIRIINVTADLREFDSIIPQTRKIQQLPMSADEIRRWRYQTLQAAINRLSQFGFVRSEGAAGSLYVEITAAGLRWLGRERPGSAYFDLANLNLAFTEQLAKVAEVKETIQGIVEENKTLRDHQEELGKRLDESQKALGQRIETFEKTVDRVEHTFYSQIFTFLAVFVAAFALILTEAQVIIRSPSTDPILLAEQTGAIMVPLTILLMLLVLFAWRVSRWR